MLTVEPCVVIDLEQLTTMNFDRRYALCIRKLYHRPNFTVGGCWNKCHHLQSLQRCYCENSGVPLVHAPSLLYDVHAVASRNRWFNRCGASGKLTLWTPPRIITADLIFIDSNFMEIFNNVSAMIYLIFSGFTLVVIFQR